MALLPVVPRPEQICIGGASLLLTVLSWRQVSFHLCLFLSLFGAMIFLRIPYPQVVFALVIGLYLLAVATVPGLRVGLGFFRWGNFGRVAWFLCIASVSTAAKNDGKINKNGQEQRGRNDGAPSRSLARA
jgi:hypothetical protein